MSEGGGLFFLLGLGLGLGLLEEYSKIVFLNRNLDGSPCTCSRSRALVPLVAGVGGLGAGQPGALALGRAVMSICGGVEGRVVSCVVLLVNLGIEFVFP